MVRYLLAVLRLFRGNESTYFRYNGKRVKVRITVPYRLILALLFFSKLAADVGIWRHSADSPQQSKSNAPALKQSP